MMNDDTSIVIKLILLLVRVKNIINHVWGFDLVAKAGDFDVRSPPLSADEGWNSLFEKSRSQANHNRVRYEFETDCCSNAAIIPSHMLEAVINVIIIVLLLDFSVSPLLYNELVFTQDILALKYFLSRIFSKSCHRKFCYP